MIYLGGSNYEIPKENFVRMDFDSAGRVFLSNCFYNSQLGILLKKLTL